MQGKCHQCRRSAPAWWRAGEVDSGQCNHGNDGGNLEREQERRLAAAASRAQMIAGEHRHEGEEPGARSRERNPMARPGMMSELQNLAAFLMAPGQCDWLTGQSIMMDGGGALATGGNFYELRSWSDDDWRVARERIEAQNAKDRAAR